MAKFMSLGSASYVVNTFFQAALLQDPDFSVHMGTDFHYRVGADPKLGTSVHTQFEIKGRRGPGTEGHLIVTLRQITGAEKLEYQNGFSATVKSKKKYVEYQLETAVNFCGGETPLVHVLAKIEILQRLVALGTRIESLLGGTRIARPMDHAGDSQTFANLDEI